MSAEFMKLPTQPGWYWAKWKIASPGTLEGSSLTPSDQWEVVEVWQNRSPFSSDESEEMFGVAVSGVREVQWLDQFYWGPMVAARVKDGA